MAKKKRVSFTGVGPGRNFKTLAEWEKAIDNRTAGNMKVLHSAPKKRRKRA